MVRTLVQQYLDRQQAALRRIYDHLAGLPKNTTRTQNAVQRRLQRVEDMLEGRVPPDLDEFADLGPTGTMGVPHDARRIGPAEFDAFLAAGFGRRLTPEGRAHLEATLASRGYLTLDDLRAEAGDPTWASRVFDAWQRFRRGGRDALLGAAQFVAGVADWVTSPITGKGPGLSDDLAVYHQWLNQTEAPDPRQDGAFTGTAAEGVGSLAGTWTAGGPLRALAVGSKTALGLSAGAAAARHGWDTAKAQGATDRDASIAALLHGLVASITEPIPLKKWDLLFARAGIAPARRQAILQGVRGAMLTQGLQAGGQAALDEAIAKFLYDHDRPLFDSLLRVVTQTASGALAPLAQSTTGQVPVNYGAKPRPLKLGRATSTDYRATFFDAHPDLKGKVVVHHAVEQQILEHYPGRFDKMEVHSLENLRGVPLGTNAKLHLSRVRCEWNKFYRQYPDATREQILQKAAEIDAMVGAEFSPPRRSKP